MIRSPWKKVATSSLLQTPAGSWVVTSTAISVPTTAVPTLVPISCAVSFSAVPMDVALAGIASTSATAQIVITVRSPIVITTIDAAMAGYPRSTPQARPPRAPASRPAPIRQAIR